MRFHLYSCACRSRRRHKQEDRGKTRGNTPCDSSSRSHGTPADRRESKGREKISTNDVRDRSRANKKARDKDPSDNTHLQKRAESRRCRIRPAKLLREEAPTTTDRGAAYRRTVPAWFPPKESPLSPKPLALSLMSN